MKFDLDEDYEWNFDLFVDCDAMFDNLSEDDKAMYEGDNLAFSEEVEEKIDLYIRARNPLVLENYCLCKDVFNSDSIEINAQRKGREVSIKIPFGS